MATPRSSIKNPFRPGAGHMPPYLAGREVELREFSRLLCQDVILENVVLTGLRGLGKTVLLETFKPMAIQEGWLWVGTDLSESTSISEERLATRLLTDLAVVTSTIVAGRSSEAKIGFVPATRTVHHSLDYPTLVAIFSQTPGLVADKLKAVFETVWAYLSNHGKRGIIFAYDEAQNLADHSARNEFPLSLLLDVFQSVQRKSIPFMLALTGLPTLLPKLVEARTYAERMFHVIFLQKLDERSSRDAVLKPIADARCPVRFDEPSVRTIHTITAGYPYFIQYVCREIFDVWVQKVDSGESPPPIPLDEIMRKLDSDFFAGRWARATDRQRDLLRVISHLENCDNEFTVQEVVEKSAKILAKPFSSSHVNQMLSTLGDAGLIYKNRWSKYSFAVPLMGQFIKRQMVQDQHQATLFDDGRREQRGSR